MNATKALVLGSVLFITVLGLAHQDPQPPEPKEQPKPAVAKAIECHFATRPIKIDGVIDETIWDSAETIELNVPWQNRAPKTRTTARILWDKEYLYFSAEMEDQDVYADVKVPNDHVWDNDSFALHIKPNEKKLGYYEFQINALNTPLQLYYPSRGSGGYGRFVGQTQLELETAVRVAGTLNDWSDKDREWSVEGRIPWTVFQPTGGRPKAGDRWRFALARRDFSVTLEQAEVSCSAPLTLPDFHRYEEYQELVFMDRK